MSLKILLQFLHFFFLRHVTKNIITKIKNFFWSHLIIFFRFVTR